MPRPQAKTIALWLICVLFCLNGCLCSREKTDEERLAERIDCSSVKLYLTIKVAILRSADSPEVAEARAQLIKLLETVSKPPAPDGAAGGLSLGDLAQVGKSLWTLRKLGADLLASGQDDALAPILPQLLDPDELSPELAAMLDANGEHMLLLSAFFLLKFHPSSPVPIPAPVMLYEASRTEPDALKLPGAAPLAHALKAYLFGMEDLCDLSSRHSAALAAIGPDDAAKLLGPGARSLGFAASALSAEEEKRFHAWLRVIGHGSACLCHRKRGDEAKFLTELEQLLQAAADAGAVAEDLAILRAYLAYRQDKMDQVKQQLGILIQSEKTSESERQDLKELLAYFEQREDGRLAKAYDKAFFAGFVYKIGKREFERTGLADRAAASPLGRELGAFSTGMGKLLEQTEGLSSSLGQAKETGRGILDKVLGDDEDD